MEMNTFRTIFFSKSYSRKLPTQAILQEFVQERTLYKRNQKTDSKFICMDIHTLNNQWHVQSITNNNNNFQQSDNFGRFRN